MNAIVVSIAAVAAAPSFVLLLQCVMSCFGRRVRHAAETRSLEDIDTATIAVVLPAHNEEAIITDTVGELLPELRPQDRLIVVADNCDDRTAQRARESGAEVIERRNDELRGKGFALRYAISHLEQNPPDVVLFLDADCRIRPGGLMTLAERAASSQRPVQAAYVMYPQGDCSTSTRISAFAVWLKNLVRPSGMQTMGLPCLLTGSGMAFPWAVLQTVEQPGGNIVEDMAYSVDLALAGVAPIPEMSVTVSSVLPEQVEAAKTQRTRWEHGHLDTICRQGPRLLWGLIRTGKVNLLAMLFDLVVPPLSLLVMLLMFMVVITTCWGIYTQQWMASWVTLGSVSALVISLMIAWVKVGRQYLSIRHIIGLPAYILKKVPIYFQFLRSPQSTWVRTARDESMQGEIQLTTFDSPPSDPRSAELVEEENAQQLGT